MGWFGGRTRKGETLQLYYNLKNERKEKTKNMVVFRINFHRDRKQAGRTMPERSAFSVQNKSEDWDIQ